MLFHTIEFALLFLACLPFAYLPFPRVRMGVLLAASYLFYMWFSIPLTSLMLFSSFLDYCTGRWIYRSTSRNRRRALLSISLVGNLGLLFFFKYTNWFSSTVNSLAMLATGRPALPYLDIILPLGISFYTFQTLSYAIDIYRGTLKPAKSWTSFALFVSFFPQLVAGPIVRAADLLPQLEAGPRFGPRQIQRGIACFVYGLVKKVVIADNLARFVAQGLGGDASAGVFVILCSVYAFAFQIYGDFSGYTDMARGLGYLLGYDVGQNFNFPYFATGVRDFWRRWHISLSTWLRDYLYVSLGGNRKGPRRRDINVMTTMLLGGLWHGANWTFVVWGGIHGLWITAENYLSGRRRGAPGSSSAASIPGSIEGALRGSLTRWAQRIFTFHMVCLAWVFFRAESLTQAMQVLRRLGTWGDPAKAPWIVFAYVTPFVAVEWIARDERVRAHLVQSPLLLWAGVWLGIGLTLALGQFGGQDFVYFQF